MLNTDVVKRAEGIVRPWLIVIDFINKKSVTTEELIKFWDEFWEIAIRILGQAHLENPQTQLWISRLKGILLHFLDRIALSDNDCQRKFTFYVDSTQMFDRIGETTMEIGLAFGRNDIIYQGKARIIYKGKDDLEKSGELMIAVKHQTGCWNHYPSQENVKEPRSDYKKGKMALKNYSASLRGKLLHSQSSRLAKLLGLKVENGYGLLV